MLYCYAKGAVVYLVRSEEGFDSEVPVSKLKLVYTILKHR